MAIQEISVVKLVKGGDGRKRPFSERGLIDVSKIVSVRPGDYDPFMKKSVIRIEMADGKIISSTNTIDEIKFLAAADEDAIQAVIDAINNAADEFNQELDYEDDDHNLSDAYRSGYWDCARFVIEKLEAVKGKRPSN